MKNSSTSPMNYLDTTTSNSVDAMRGHAELLSSSTRAKKEGCAGEISPLV